VAEEAGLSRAEVLRRGLRSFAAERAGGKSPLFDYLMSIAGDDWPADMAERHDEYLTDGYREEAGL